MITNLKYLAFCSGVANICMATGIGVVFYYAFQDLPHPSEREYVGELSNLPLLFGTAIFAFEGIALVSLTLKSIDTKFEDENTIFLQVLPLKNAMAKSSNFDRPLGVMNIGMVFVTVVFVTFGFFGYLKWGNETAGSLTLNLPQDAM